MRSHAVGHRAHQMFANAAVHVGPAASVACEGPQATLVAGWRFEIGAADHALGQYLRQVIVDVGRDEDAGRCVAFLDGALFVVEQDFAPTRWKLATDDAVEFGALTLMTLGCAHDGIDGDEANGVGEPGGFDSAVLVEAALAERGLEDLLVGLHELQALALQVAP